MIQLEQREHLIHMMVVRLLSAEEDYGWQIDQKAELKELTELIKTEKNPGQRTCLFP